MCMLKESTIITKLNENLYPYTVHKSLSIDSIEIDTNPYGIGRNG